MLRRLNGWQRIGIVLSSLWVLLVVGTAGFEYLHPESGSSFFVESEPGAPQSVTRFPAPAATVEQKSFTVEELYGPPKQYRFKAALLAMALLVPLVLLWLIAYVVVGVVRWVRVGFRGDET